MRERSTRAEHVYARMLRVFSREFRERFASDLIELFRDKHRAAARAGRIALLLFWIRIVIDVLRTAIAQRLGGWASLEKREPLMEGLAQDVRHAARLIGRRPGLSLIIVLTLALGIGANTAIFSLVNTVLLKPSPYPESDRLVMIWEQHLERGFSTLPVKPANFFDWQGRAPAFEEIAWSRDGMFNLSGDGEPESVMGYRFSANMFHVLGVQPALGRAFRDDEDRPGAPRVVVISDKLWKRRYGGDPGVLGRGMTLNGNGYEIIGVMPPAFDHPQGAELWTPIALTPQLMSNRRGTILRLVGRLKPGVPRERADAELDAIYQELSSRHTENVGLTSTVVPFGTVGDAKPLLLVLLAGVGFVLLIACANVANLLLADAASRRRELAVRSALGASRFRVARQMLTESVLLSFAGGALGVFVTWWTRDALLVLFPDTISNLDLPRVEAIQIDARVFAFGLGVSLLTGVLFGLLPAWHAARANLQGALKDGDRAGSASRRTHGVLVIVEVALAVVLLAGALLMVQSFARLQRGTLGFEPDGVMSARITLPAYRFASVAAAETFVRRALEQVRAIPGVERAGVTNYLPLSGWSGGVEFGVEGRPASPSAVPPSASYHVATDDYFETMRIPVRAGRVFTARDDRNAPSVVVINETLAARYWPGENVVGRGVLIPTNGQPERFEIVGVIGDVRTAGLEEPVEPQMYFSFWQGIDSIVGIVARTSLDPSALAPQIRRAVGSVDRELPLTYVMPMSELAAESLAFRRAGMTLAAAFGLLALALAAIGIYGVLSYSVSRRTRELGVRVALGATRLEIGKVVLREGLAMTLIGIAAGLAAALALTRFMAGMLYEVQPRDPLTLIAVVSTLVAVALVAILLPARRATSVDPLIALRAD